MIGAGVRQGLAQEGFAVDWVRDGAAAEARAGRERPRARAARPRAAAQGRPRVLAAMRRRGDTRPVLVLTARDARRRPRRGPRRRRRRLPRQAVRARRARGAAARARAPRVGPRRAARSSCRRVDDRPGDQRSARGGAPVALSAREYALLEALLRAPGRDPVARAARGAALRLEGRGRKQRGRGPPVEPAAQARPTG